MQKRNQPKKFSEFKDRLKVCLVLIFVYVALFEFILPPFKFIPKPGLLFESFLALWTDYNLFYELAVTTSVVYLAMLLGYMVFYIERGILIKIFIEYPGVANISGIAKYFPFFVIALLTILFFGDSLIVEFAFGFLMVYFFMVKKLLDELPNVKKEYIDSANSLGMTKSKIYKNIIYRSVLPSIFIKFKDLHFALWTVILVYEFIGGFSGIGSIYKSTFNYGDVAGIYALAIFISLLVFIGNMVISFINEKVIYWES